MMNAIKVILICAVGLSAKTYAAFIPDPAPVVAAHNSIRDKVGVPPLVWSDALAQVAEEWANKLMSTGQFMHSSDLRYGENLYQISGPGATSSAFEVVNAWAGEAAVYDYATNTCRGRCGHYTQIVWRDTKQVGCAVAHDSRREVWVCEYAPFGNIIGERPY
jgi:pathogenesis-related protein 1